jgi:hypothetical protein
MILRSARLLRALPFFRRTSACQNFSYWDSNTVNLGTKAIECIVTAPGVCWNPSGVTTSAITNRTC